MKTIPEQNAITRDELDIEKVIATIIANIPKTIMAKTTAPTSKIVSFFMNSPLPPK
jgi:hypothetical protein